MARLLSPQRVLKTLVLVLLTGVSSFLLGLSWSHNISLSISPRRIQRGSTNTGHPGQRLTSPTPYIGSWHRSPHKQLLLKVGSLHHGPDTKQQHPAKQQQKLGNQQKNIGNQQQNLGQQQQNLGNQQNNIGNQQKNIGNQQQNLGNQQQGLGNQLQGFGNPLKNLGVQPQLLHKQLHTSTSDGEHRNIILNPMANSHNYSSADDSNEVLSANRRQSTQEPGDVNRTGGLVQPQQVGNQSSSDVGLSHLTPCDKECQLFRQLLLTWPADRPRAAIYYLTQPSRLEYLVESLRRLDTFFNDQFHYPIIIFHERDFSAHKQTARLVSKSRLFFQQITFQVPEFLDRVVPLHISCPSPISYRHMCRFHAKMVFQEAIMQGLEYYWRLDDDSFLLSEIPYDVFTFMRDNSLQYGYIWKHSDALSCTEGLWEASAQYIQQENMTTQFFNNWKRPSLFYNNFEIAKTDVWMSKQYGSFMDYIDRLGGIFFHRWGDAPIKGIAVAMFVPVKQVHYFKDIGYKHRTFVNNGTRIGT